MQASSTNRCLSTWLVAGLLLWPGAAARAGAVADVHVHYNWDQAELVDPAEAVRRLEAEGVVLAVVFSTPSDMARRLYQAAPGRVVPLYSPYVTPAARHTWYADESLPARVREALAEGPYRGIGEVHLIPGIGPRRDNPVLGRLLALAREFRVPFVIHTEASDWRYFLPLCRRWREVRFQWAHAGGILPPAQVARLLAACPNVWADLSARDPWHYGGLTDEAGRLLPGWRQVLERFPRRFMVGSDPVWAAHEVERWDAANEGWDHLGRLWAFHRRWLEDLPADLRRRLVLDNALEFYGAARAASASSQ